MRKYFFGILFLSFIFAMVSAVNASEDITIEYKQVDIGDVNRYWYGQGELTVTDLEKSFVLENSGNEIVSYATNAIITNISDDKMEFLSDEDENQLQALFMTQKPEGHGLFTLDFSAPYVSKNESRNITIRIENAERILYLNGPIFFEKNNIYSEGNSKIIQFNTSSKDLKVIYLTKLAYGIFSSLIGISIFGFILFLMILLRRKTISQVMKFKLRELSKSLPISLYEANQGVEIKFRRKHIPSARKEVSHDEPDIAKTFFTLRIPRVVFAITFVLMLSYIIFRSIISMISGYVLEMGAGTYVILGMLSGVGLMMLILLLSVKDEKEFNITMSVFIGGVTLIMFSKMELLTIPVAIIVSLLVYGLSKTFVEKLDVE